MTTVQPPPTDRTPLGDWQGIHPLSVWADTAVGAVFIVPTAIIGTVVLVVLGHPWWAVAPLPGALALIAGLTAVDMVILRAISYRVTDERMEMRSGVFAKTYRSVPRERVRSVDVAAPLYTRPFGLCSVTIGTGEQAGSDRLKLQFVTVAQGERLRRELLHRAGAGGPTPEGAETDETTGLELARLDPRWFSYAPATTATLGIGIGAIAALIGANAQSEGWIYRWISEQAGLPSTAEIGSFVMTRALVVVPLSLLTLLVSGAVVLLAVAVETWWDYRLTREGDGTVRLRRGLLTSVSLSVEGRRLNGVTLHEPFVLRAVGGAAVRAVATGLSAGDDEKTQAKSRLSPAMPRARARTLAADLMRTPESPLDPPLTPHPRAALRRRFVRAGWAAVAGLVVAGTLTWLHSLATAAWWEVAHGIEEELNPLPVATYAVESAPAWGWWVLGAAFGAMAFWYAFGSYRALGHGLHPRYLVVRQGMAVRDTVALERSAVIGWRITRSPFQRRVGLASVSATTAAGEGVYTATDVGLGQGLAWAEEAVPDLLTEFLERDTGPGVESGGGRG
ncbi:PH domain-containing protein [Nocardiopsis sp. N85]|uniref:PH domain-containing protein n=1 Tax=Nocardiopsis sp. N85 TaxID=3029400 RepID=UPI00237FA398|nr:PH domain-containing protein [Nocardiopsis sp. N85]MDE3722274.1 PH domain-containing protein [Nocardiopsis sp. N85]